MEKKKLLFPSLAPDAQHEKVNKILTLQRQNDIIQLLLEGRERQEIVKYISSKYNVKANTIAGYITDANNIIKQRSNNEVNNLISLHVQRYEIIYAGLYEINAYGLAMSSLRAKEKLLGFHKEGFHMRVSSGEISSIQLQSVNSEYDVMKLDRQKRDRMSALLNKAKRDRKAEIKKKNDKARGKNKKIVKQ